MGSSYHGGLKAASFLCGSACRLGLEFRGLTKAHLVKIPPLLVRYFMDSYRQQALRARDLAEKADQFTRKRLLSLADRYDETGRARNDSNVRPSDS
jgi:hypothetical protein